MAISASVVGLLCLPFASAFVQNAPLASAPRRRCVQHSIRAEFGDNFYLGAEGPLPENVFEVAVKKPLGIQFEEKGPIVGKSGLVVIGLVDGGNAALSNQIREGDALVGVTAVQFSGAKWERKMFDCTKWGFDTVVDAIGSNEEKFECYDVILQFSREP